jgi:hypothetical protein
MKILLIVAVLASLSFSCNDRSAVQTNVVTKSSETARSAAVTDSNSKQVNLADSATNMLNKAEDKMEEAADKTKDAVNK